MKINVLVSQTMDILRERVEKDVYSSITCAVVYNKSKLISIGFSSPMTHIIIRGKKQQTPSQHAEEVAISRILNNSARIKYKKNIHVNILILRYSKIISHACSKPCKHCLKFLNLTNFNTNVKIKRVSYFNKNGELKTKHLYDIRSKHISSGWRRYFNK